MSLRIRGFGSPGLRKQLLTQIFWKSGCAALRTFPDRKPAEAALSQACDNVRPISRSGIAKPWSPKSAYVL